MFLLGWVEDAKSELETGAGVIKKVAFFSETTALANANSAA
jgi:hypothetical protein